MSTPTVATVAKPMTPPERSWKDAAQSLTAGGIAGMVSRTCVSPLERLKILLQVQHVTGHDTKPKYTSQWQGLKMILREEGVRGFFKGNGANLVRVFPYTGIQFLTMDTLSAYRKRQTGKEHLSPLEKQLVGGLSGMASVTFTYPLDVARGRLTAQGGVLGRQYNGLADTLVKMAKAEGLRSWYHGFTSTFFGVFVYVGVNFMTYETVKEWGPQPAPFLWKVLAAGIAGTSGQSVSYPSDLLRRRFQLQSMPNNPMPAEKRYKSIADAVRRIYAEEGVRGFFKGFVPNFIKTWPTISIMFICNDVLLDFFKRTW